MYRIFAVLLLFCLAWAPDNFYKRDTTETQLLTRAPPTLVTEGFDQTNLVGFTAIVKPLPAGGTFVGGGEMHLYFYDTTAGWYVGDALTIRNFTKCAGKTSCSFTYDVLQPRGRALVAASAVTTSAGTEVSVRTIGTLSGKSLSY